MIDLFPFNGYCVVVFGLGDEGRITAKSLHDSGAEVWAWDDDPGKREFALEQDIPLMELDRIDWREPVTMIIEAHIPHGESECHPYVVAARKVNCEVVSDVELLARTQREAAFVGVTGHQGRNIAVDAVSYVMKVCGREVETTGLDGDPALGLYPLSLDGAYVVEMPPSKLDITVSITFEIALWLNFDAQAFANDKEVEAEINRMKWIFHRQTAPKTAIVSFDDPVSRKIFDGLNETGDQVLVPISGIEVIPGGVGIDNHWLIDDRENTAIQVINLQDVVGFNNEQEYRIAAAAYATGVSIGLESHAVMACLNSYNPD